MTATFPTVLCLNMKKRCNELWNRSLIGIKFADLSWVDWKSIAERDLMHLCCWPQWVDRNSPEFRGYSCIVSRSWIHIHRTEQFPIPSIGIQPRVCAPGQRLCANHPIWLTGLLYASYLHWKYEVSWCSLIRQMSSGMYTFPSTVVFIKPAQNLPWLDNH